MDKRNSDFKKVGNYVYNKEKIVRKESLGYVYEGADTVNKNKVCVKIVKKSQFQGNKYKEEALLRESRVLSKIKSPHVVNRLDSKESSNSIYLIEQYTDDQTLFDLLAKNKSLDPQLQHKYICQLVNGFIELIKHGIVHRAVSSKNILIFEGNLKISDFGYSRFATQSQNLGTKINSYECVAPQIISNTPQYSYKCDIWSFGVICYFIATGSYLPIKKANSITDFLDYLKEVSEKGVEYPSNIKIQPQLKDLISGCLKFQQKIRFDWKDILKHPYFKGQFEKIENPAFNMDFQYDFVITRLRFIIQESGNDLNIFLKELDNSITRAQFSQKLKRYDKNLDEDEIQEMFNACCDEGKNTIDKKVLIEKFKSYKMLVIDKKASTNYDEKVLKNLARKINQFMETKDIDIFEIFRQIDVKKTGQIKLADFTKIFQKAGYPLTEQQSKVLFTFFDKDGSKTVDFKEFNAGMNALLEQAA